MSFNANKHLYFKNIEDKSSKNSENEIAAIKKADLYKEENKKFTQLTEENYSVAILS